MLSYFPSSCLVVTVTGLPIIKAQSEDSGFAAAGLQRSRGPLGKCSSGDAQARGKSA
jgi:hypothetical protein